MPKSDVPVPELTETQIKMIDEWWENDPKKDIGEITRKVFGDETLDGRSNQAKAIKNYLTGHGRVFETTKKPPKKYVLDEHQRATIETMRKNSKTSEIAKLLFPDDKLTVGDARFRAIYEYTKALDSDSVDIWDEAVESKEYKPPSTIGALIGRINSHVSNPKSYQRALYDQGKMKASDDRNIQALMGYMRSKQFIYQASGYTRFVDRELFESNFIRYTHDKAADISQGEVNLYISAAAKTIQIAKLERSIESLEGRLQDSFAAQDDKEGSSTKLSMTLVELISTSRKELGVYTGQHKSLLDGLEGERNKRIKDRHDRNSSMIDFFTAFKEDEEFRNQIIDTLIEEKEADAADVRRIKGMADVMGLIAGYTEEEAAN